MKEIAKTVADLDSFPQFADYHLVQNEDEVLAVREHFDEEDEYHYYFIKVEEGYIFDAYGSFSLSYRSPVYQVKVK